MPYTKPWLSHQDQLAQLQRRGMTITDVRVREKHGGKSGSYVNP